jgi:hypothetical protein
MPDFSDLVEAYKAKFGDVPTTACLSSEILDRAAELLTEAVERNLPYGSDGEWYGALGVEAPADDDLI